MPETIKKRDAIKTTWMILGGLGYTKENNAMLAETVKEVFNTAPMIALVKCKNCVHYVNWHGYPSKFCELHDAMMHGDDFCSRGERRRTDDR